MDAAGRASGNAAHPTRSQTSSAAVLQGLYDGPVPFERVRFRGDSSSYVDVFDDAILGRDAAGRWVLSTEGANVVRIEYPWSFADGRSVEVRPADHVDGQLLPWRGGRAVRFYDRGACSAEVSWRQVAEPFWEGIHDKLREIQQIFPLLLCGFGTPYAYTLTPILRQEVLSPPTQSDSFRFAFHFSLGVGSITGPCTAFRFRMVFEGSIVLVPLEEAPAERRLGFRTRWLEIRDDDGEVVTEHFLMPVLDYIANGIVEGFDQGLRYGVRHVFEDAAAACDADQAGADDYCFNTYVRDVAFVSQIPRDDVPRHRIRCVPDATGVIGEDRCAFLPEVLRLNLRPDGLEVVLSETAPYPQDFPIGGEPSPYYPLYAFAGLCDRPVDGPPAGKPLVSHCVLGPIVAGQQRGVCGDALDAAF